MKKLFILLAAMGGILSGCVGYVVPYNDSGYGNRPPHQGTYRGDRDRDRDGIPNRRDRDRDGDGVPNWNDSRPDNPYRY